MTIPRPWPIRIKHLRRLVSNSGGLYVTLTCQSSTYGEGESAPGAPRTVRVYTLDAVACNSTTCPDNARAVTPGYVERRRQVQLSDG